MTEFITKKISTEYLNACYYNKAILVDRIGYSTQNYTQRGRLKVFKTHYKTLQCDG